MIFVTNWLCYYLKFIVLRTYLKKISKVSDKDLEMNFWKLNFPKFLLKTNFISHVILAFIWLIDHTPKTSIIVSKIYLNEHSKTFLQILEIDHMSRAQVSADNLDVQYLDFHTKFNLNFHLSTFSLLLL